MLDINNSDIAEYIISNNATVRQTADYFHTSHQTICNRMKKHNQVQEIFKKHFKNKYINGLLA